MPYLDGDFRFDKSEVIGLNMVLLGLDHLHHGADLNVTQVDEFVNVVLDRHLHLDFPL